MNEIDDSNLAQCCACGFVDYWDEIPKGRCPWSEEYLTECPECGEVDNMADYTAEKAKTVYQRLFDKQMMPHPSLDSLKVRV